MKIIIFLFRDLIDGNQNSSALWQQILFRVPWNSTHQALTPGPCDSTLYIGRRPMLQGRCDSTKPHWGCALFEPEVPAHALRVLTLEMDGLL